MKQATIDRFMDKVSPEPNSGCWLWTASTTCDGYGWFKTGRAMLAHRTSWQMHRGDIPPGLYVLHRCDVRCCVNPDHLFLGAHQDNMTDMVRKGRHRPASQRGVAHGGAKIDDDTVRAIRADTRLQREIAAEYGLCQQHVSDIKLRRIWSHVA